jgi:hypothetical protein
MNQGITIGQRAREEALGALDRTLAGILASMALIWSAFQVVEIQAVFPPIGILYALGSTAIAAVIVVGRPAWGPALAAGWGALMMVPESIPAIGHLTDWSEIYSHFVHYLVIVTFFPLAIALVATGIGATVRIRRGADTRQAPAWLPPALLALAALIAVANTVVIALYTFDIP